jgi:repressor of nif and glnA expression
MIERRIGEIPTLETRSEANETVDKKKRYKQIIEVLQGGKEMTAKEIAVEMCNRGYIPTSERNFTAPRLTELSKNGVVEPVGKQRCSYTGKTVCVYALLEKQTDIYDFI